MQYPEHDKIVELLINGAFITHIKKILKLPYSVESIVKRYKSISDSIKNTQYLKIESVILDEYKKTLNITKVIQKTGYGVKMVKKVLKNNGILHKKPTRGRKYLINDSYFDSIDSNEKAYYLGLLFADGTIIWNDKVKNYGFKISLTESDSYILNKLNESVKFGKPMNTYKYKNNKGRPATHLWVYSKILAERLIKLGCVVRKSSILKMPAANLFNIKYMPHFIRGYFDGDGGVSVQLPNISLRITSSHNFCNELLLFLKENVGITSGRVQNRGNFSDYVIGTKIDKVKFYHYIYKDNEGLFLVRKKEKIESIFSHLKDLKTRKKLNKNQQLIMQMGTVE